MDRTRTCLPTPVPCIALITVVSLARLVLAANRRRRDARPIRGSWARTCTTRRALLLYPTPSALIRGVGQGRIYALRVRDARPGHEALMAQNLLTPQHFVPQACTDTQRACSPFRFVQGESLPQI